MKLEDFLASLNGEEIEGLQMKFGKSRNLDMELAMEVNDNLRDTIQKEYNSKIIDGQQFDTPKRHIFHTIFKLENGQIIDTLMTVDIQKFGLAINIKHRPLFQ